MTSWVLKSYHRNRSKPLQYLFPWATEATCFAIAPTTIRCATALLGLIVCLFIKPRKPYQTCSIVTLPQDNAASAPPKTRRQIQRQPPKPLRPNHVKNETGQHEIQVVCDTFQIYPSGWLCLGRGTDPSLVATPNLGSESGLIYMSYSHPCEVKKRRGMSTAYSAAKALGINLFKHPCESMCLRCYGAQRVDIIKEHVLAPLIMTPTVKWHQVSNAPSDHYRKKRLFWYKL